VIVCDIRLIIIDGYDKFLPD